MKDAKNCIYPPEGTSEAAIAMPSHMVNFTEILILCRLGVDSNVEFLNKLTLAARREKNLFPGRGGAELKIFGAGAAIFAGAGASRASQ